MGEKKVALFALIPDNDSSFNFLVSILYTQLFQQLFYSADHIHGGALPVPVHFLMDEFANVSLPDDFDKILSVMRSRGVSVSIILQNLAQLKALFEKQWESIVGNCDEFLEQISIILLCRRQTSLTIISTEIFTKISPFTDVLMFRRIVMSKHRLTMLSSTLTI